MWIRKLWKIISPRGAFSSFAFGVGLIAGGSQMLVTYIIGGLAVLFAVGLTIYNIKNPQSDSIPKMEDAIRKSKVVWGFWHTGQRIRSERLLKHGSIKRILLVEPNKDKLALQYVKEEAKEEYSNLITNIEMTAKQAISNEIETRWHNEITALSFMICDPSPKVDSKIVEFSNKAYVVAQVLDRNLIRSEWTLYKKDKANNPFAFEGYVKWYKDIWENRSKIVEGNAHAKV